MASDRSRSVDKLLYGYTGPVAQQGRVILDRDFNALQALTADRIAADALDFVGPCGTPDDGFRISLPESSPPGPPFWTPPGGQHASPPDSPGARGDFLIAPGTMYVGGQRVTFPAEQNGKIITYSYLDQPDWPAPPLPSSEPDYELVYLELTELEVSAVEDPDQLEVALGGPDTTQRLKLLRRVWRMKVSSANCSVAWAEATKVWTVAGWAFDAATMQLLPLARLKVGFTQDASISNPCDPATTGGYLGADNQLIRGRIAGSGSNTQLIWGYDNASFLYRVTSVSSDGTTLTLASDPPDGFHVPQTGQVIEVLTTAAVLGEEPDETDPTGKRQILRAAAAATGTLCELAQPYGPVTAGDATNYIVLTKALPSDIANSPLPLFLRVWQAALPLPAAGGQITIADPTTNISTGVTATISSAATGAGLADGVYWEIAVRPSTPQGVYPEDLLTAPQPPDGPRRWICPLAVINWSAKGGATIADCRNGFDSLVALTRRKPGCCTVSISAADVTAATPLQMLIDAAAAKAQTVTVCLSAGSYLLPSPLRLDGRHNGLTLESCGGTVELGVDPSADASLFADGLVVLTNARKVTLRNLLILPVLSPVSKTLVNGLLDMASRDNVAAATNAFGNAFSSYGVRALNAPYLTLDGCTSELIFVRTDKTADIFAAAVFLQGDCSGLTVCDCSFGAKATTLTYTELDLPGDTNAVSAIDKSRFDDAVHRMLIGQAPPSPPPTTDSQIDDQVASSFELLLVKRTIVNAAAPSGVIATAGIIAAPYSGIAEKRAGFACALGDTTIRDCSFTGLTFGISICGVATSIRVQDNRVTNGIAGLWILAPGAVAPAGAPAGADAYYPQCAIFEESVVATVLATTATPPIDPLQETAPSATLPQSCSLFIVGNQIQAEATTANMALYMPLNILTAAEEPVNGSSLVISDNRLSSTCAVDIPTALLTLPQNLPCAITGNMVLSVRSGDPAPSLWLIVQNSANGAPLLSVAGNVLRGNTDINVIPKPGNTDGWYSYNAVQK